MLQRAASNAYSWWWASHIRTKQSKWLEQNLQDMEEKVTAVLKLIEEDGDSFAKRAEMYYKKRPELIHFVEESYRAYRALAERYDLMSKELQNANSTLASAFPDQFQFSMEDNDDGSPGDPKKSMGNNKQNPKIPDVPKQFPSKKIKAIMALTSKTNNNKQLPRNAGGRSENKDINTTKFGSSKAQALEEIDKLQKAILTKQTEKEFTKSSYESGVAKYWEIEQDITEMQEKVSKLQDEFGIAKDIEDNEARSLMLEAALKSCQDTLAQLQEKQERSAAEAREERQKIKDAREKLLSFKGEVLGGDQITNSEPASEEGEKMTEGEENWVIFDDKVDSSSQAKELGMLRDKIKEHFEMGYSLSVSDMAEKIDKLVNKVINLETAVSSQTAIIQRLRTETDELHTHIQNLEDDKANLIDGKNSLNEKLREMKDKLKRLQELDHSVESRNSHLQMQLIDASCDVDEISQKLPTVKLDEEIGQTESEQVVIAAAQLSSSSEESAKKNDISGDNQAEQDESKPIPQQEEPHNPSKELLDPETVEEMKDSSPAAISDVCIVQQEHARNEKADEPVQNPERVEELRDSSPFAIGGVSITQQEEHSRNKQADEPTRTSQAAQPEENAKQEEDEPNWQQLFVEGLEGKEKILLNEYTSILRNYKEVKKKLVERMNKSEDSLTELRELKIENAKKDEELQSLRQKLFLLQQKLEEYMNLKEIKEDNNSDPPVPSPEKDNEIINFIVDEPRTVSPVEEKLRADIDEILEENLDFWIRFSSSFSQVQKCQSEIEDLQKELGKIENEKKKEGSSSAEPLKSDARPIYKHLKEIQTELTVRLEKNVELKDELKCRFSQLCRIQEDITRALNDGALDDEMKFTSFQAAKFKGEVLNMQQENKKVEDELQAGVDHVTNLHIEVERTISRLNEELGISGSKSQMKHAGSKNRIPLRAFIFGDKTKKQKQSILSSVRPTRQKKFQHLKSGHL